MANNCNFNEYIVSEKQSKITTDPDHLLLGFKTNLNLVNKKKEAQQNRSARFLRILSEKYIEHQLPVYHNSIDFKKAFDRVWHKALWLFMQNTKQILP